MSRKDFNAIAAAIKSEATSAPAGMAIQIIREVAESIANVCADSNPRFDRTRFLTACGVIGGDK